MCKGLNSLLLGLNDGNPYNGYIKPLHYRVDDHHILYGNIGSLDALDSITPGFVWTNHLRTHFLTRKGGQKAHSCIAMLVQCDMWTENSHSHWLAHDGFQKNITTKKPKLAQCHSKIACSNPIHSVIDSRRPKNVVTGRFLLRSHAFQICIL